MRKKRKSTENEAEVEVLEVNDDGSDENCRAAILEADRYYKDKNENENLNLSIAELYFDMIAKYAYKWFNVTNYNRKTAVQMEYVNSRIKLDDYVNSRAPTHNELSKMMIFASLSLDHVHFDKINIYGILFFSKRRK
jgi:hypothetical protein